MRKAWQLYRKPVYSKLSFIPHEQAVKRTLQDLCKSGKDK